MASTLGLPANAFVADTIDTPDAAIGFNSEHAGLAMANENDWQKVGSSNYKASD